MRLSLWSAACEMAIVPAQVRAASVAILAATLVGGWWSEVWAEPNSTLTPSIQPSCIGDCNGDELVVVPEIVTGVNIALDRVALDACPAFACNGPDVDVYINCGVSAVRNALDGCPTLVPSPTPTALATRTPPPTVSVVYELAKGSTILMSSATPGSLPIVEPLSGTFVVRVDCGNPLACVPVRGPNVLFVMTIISIAFQSPHFIVGGMGSIHALSFYPQVAYAGGTLLIAGEAFPAGGQGPIVPPHFPDPAAHFPPSFSPLELCAHDASRYPTCEEIRTGIESGYVLTLFAVPRP